MRQVVVENKGGYEKKKVKTLRSEGLKVEIIHK